MATSEERRLWQHQEYMATQYPPRAPAPQPPPTEPVYRSFEEIRREVARLKNSFITWSKVELEFFGVRESDLIVPPSPRVVAMDKASDEEAEEYSRAWHAVQDQESRLSAALRRIEGVSKEERRFEMLSTLVQRLADENASLSARITALEERKSRNGEQRLV